MNEIPGPLSPAHVNSFAYNTFKDRLPVILVKIVDSLYRNKAVFVKDIGEDKIDCLKYITAEMSRLRHELTTNKPITFFEDGSFGDENLWNDAILEEKRRLIESKKIDVDITWFQCSFLFGECYMYRRVYDAVMKSGLHQFDQFSFEKIELLQNAIKTQQHLTSFLINIWPTLATCEKSVLLSHFETMIKMSLWANEADLSLSIDDNEAKIKLDNPQKIVEDNNNKLLIDDFQDIFEFLYKKSKIEQKNVTVTIFVDNSGSEFFADLHFVEFLLESNLATKVIIIVKSIPWYVSDVTERDFHFTIKNLCDNTNTICQWLGRRILSRVTEEFSCLILSNYFLTLPYPFHKMKLIFPDFYNELSNSTLLVFKGDLNYRKLVSDLQWPITNTTFQDSLLGFHPAPIVALRVLKCDVQVGLSAENLSRVQKEHPDDWMISSRYGVIQSCFFIE